MHSPTCGSESIGGCSLSLSLSLYVCVKLYGLTWSPVVSRVWAFVHAACGLSCRLSEAEKIKKTARETRGRLTCPFFEFSSSPSSPSLSSLPQSVVGRAVRLLLPSQTGIFSFLSVRSTSLSRSQVRSFNSEIPQTEFRPRPNSLLLGQIFSNSPSLNPDCVYIHSCKGERERDSSTSLSSLHEKGGGKNLPARTQLKPCH